jgi:fructose-1,6-bisphosphatase/inositol monophosphatase family enzyme
MGNHVIDSINSILNDVIAAGRIGAAAQKEMRGTDRIEKIDGSVVTETDKRIEDYLFARIATLYPETNILTEETTRSFDPEQPYTFAIDPIDGTDAFSQGMISWCVSVGLLDRTLTPIAGIVYAPRMDLPFFADVGQRATLNGVAIAPPDPAPPLTRASNLMVTSHAHLQFDIRRLPGKIRSIGSAALHLCYPLVYRAVYGAIENANGHIWDIAGAHGINRSLDFEVELLSGGVVDYAGMVDGGPVGDVILAGHRQRIDKMRAIITAV